MNITPSMTCRTSVTKNGRPLLLEADWRDLIEMLYVTVVTSDVKSMSEVVRCTSGEVKKPRNQG